MKWPCEFVSQGRKKFPKIYRSGEKIKTWPVDIPRRKLVAAKIGLISSRFTPVIPNRFEPLDVLRGLGKRILRQTPEINTPYAEKFLNFSSKLFDALFPINWDIKPVSFDEWVNHGSYTGKQIVLLTQLHDQFLYDCKTVNDLDFTQVDMFVKNEIYECFKELRGIFPDHDMNIKVYYGRYIHAVEKHLYPYLIQMGFAIKGLSVDQIAVKVWSHGDFRYVMENDFSSFEACYSYIMEQIEIMLWEHVVNMDYIDEYKMYTTHSLRERKVVNRVSGVSFKTCYRRMSGSLTTSLTHLLFNFCFHSYLYYLSGIPKTEWFGLFEGDDALTMSNQPVCVNVTEVAANLGVIAKPVLKTSLYYSGFCHNYSNPVDFAVVRDPREILVKLGWSLEFNKHPKKLPNLYKAKLLSYLSTYPYCPIIAPICRKELSKVWYFEPIFVEDWYHRSTIVMRDGPVSSHARKQVEDLWGISCGTQIWIEDYPYDDVYPQGVDDVLATHPSSDDWSAMTNLRNF